MIQRKKRLDMKEKYTQWHPAFCAAVKLELADNKEELGYFSEYNVNTKPVQIDLLVIEKFSNVHIYNEIGRIFRGHNIMEYKSPEDLLDLDTFVKVIGYACLYKANEKHTDEIRLDDITLSFVRERYPRELFKWFKANNFAISKPYAGIYYVAKEGFFPIQIIVSGQLNRESHTWLTSLSRNLKEQDVKRLVQNMNSLSEKEDMDNADSVLQVSAMENRKLFNWVKEGDVMCEALMEIMKPEFDAALSKAVNKAVDEAVDVTAKETRIQTVMEMYQDKEISLEIACKHLGFTKEEFLEEEKRYNKKHNK